MDWVFDFMLQYMQSKRFDAAVMDFVDRRCFLFDNSEENKLIYTEMHNEFKQHVEDLITTELGDLGVTTQTFYEACESGRRGRTINEDVFERIVALEDFMTFKRIMVNRNLELQYEVLASYNAKAGVRGRHDDEDDDMVDNDRRIWDNLDSKTDDYDDELDAALQKSLADSRLMELPDPDLLQTLKESEMDSRMDSKEDDDDLEQILKDSLLEMEMLHRRQELEQAELAQALSVSFALEQERLRLMFEELQAITDREFSSPSLSEPKSSQSSTQVGSSKDAIDSKPHSSSATATTVNSKSALSTESKPAEASPESTKSRSAVPPDSKISEPVSGAIPSKSVVSPEFKSNGSGRNDNKAVENVKPIAVKVDKKPIDGIGELARSSASRLESTLVPSTSTLQAQLQALNTLSEGLEERKRQADTTIQQSQAQLRRQEELLQEHLKVVETIDPESVARKAEYMQEQRDKILVLKKSERDKKARLEERESALPSIKMSGARAGPLTLSPVRSPAGDRPKSEEKIETIGAAAGEVQGGSLLSSLVGVQPFPDLDEVSEEGEESFVDSQFEGIDRRLQEAERLRRENRRRDEVLAENLRRQQANIARNAQRSTGRLRSTEF